MENKMKNKKIIIISLGGSIICPKPGEINVKFLKEFKNFILSFLGKGFKFIIVTGGGKTCRFYQAAAKDIGKTSDEDLDWLGVHSTKINAHLLRTIFQKVAYRVVLDSPHKRILSKWRLLIASGWRPGWSTDYITVLLAKRFRVREFINAGNVSFVYNKDPFKYKNLALGGNPVSCFARNKNAVLFKNISWKEYRKIVGSEWTPGFSSPIDPIAAKLAQKLKIRAIVTKGTELDNLKKIILGEKFRGTIIE